MISAWLLLAPLAATPDPGLVVDRVVARIDDTVITQSELTAEARLVLLDARSPQAAIDTELSRPLLTAVLRSMVHRALLRNEMRRLQLRPAPDEQVLADLERLVRRFEDPEDFFRFLVDIGLADPDGPRLVGFEAPPGIVARLRLEREVNRFVEVRIRPSLVTSEREVRACYEANPERFADQPLARVEAQIRLRLRAKKEVRALDALLSQLERRARVRIEAPYDAPLVPEAPDPLGLECPERAP